jgi:hypothetical protein
MNPNPPNSPELTSRLVPLFDGRPGIRGTMHVEISEPIADDSQAKAGAAAAIDADLKIGDVKNPEPSTASAPILDFVSSDDSLDRFGEIIDASGWRLENYRRNPVFQNAHQYGDVIFTLGRALITEIRQVEDSFSSSSSSSGLALFQRIQFATDINPMARIAYGLYQGKFLNAVSVGFVPIRWVDGNGKEYSSKSFSSSSSSSNSASGSESSSLNLERGASNSTAAPYRRKYLEQELLEVSAVAIPANPNALALGLKAGAIQRADLQEGSDLLRLALEPLGPNAACDPLAECAHKGLSAPTQFCGTPAGSNTDTRALGLRAFEAQLLQLARALKEALRH